VSSHQSYLDELYAFASRDSMKESLLKAKAVFFAGAGEPLEDDRTFDQRMALMLDYFLFDRPLEGGRTPAAIFAEEQAGKRPAFEVERLRGLAKSHHSLFEVRKFPKDGVRLRDLLAGGDRDVFERRKLAGLNKGDIFDARLLPFDGKFVFSTAFCFHPITAKPNIMKEIKRRKVHELNPPSQPFLWMLCKMALKVERYRNIAVENIYRFDGAGV
jgi:hypothetical protein